MPGKTFAPLTQSMLLFLDEMSHGLRRESHPARVAFLCLELMAINGAERAAGVRALRRPIVDVSQMNS
jgi:hypothetical protein